MPRWIYINGRYKRAGEAHISFQDRGFQFGDGVYGVIAYYKGRFIDQEAHLQALASYCQRIHLSIPVQPQALKVILQELVRRNNLRSAHIYIQVTRGQATRLHRFPDISHPTLVVVASPWQFSLDSQALPCVKVISTPDIRWRCSDVKTTSMLPTVLLRQKAHQQGAFETWLLDDKQHVIEGASSNAFIVTSQGVLVTRPSDGFLIPGVTRARLLNLARSLQLSLEERPFSLTETYEASEAFLTGATSLIKAVTYVDDRKIGQGHPGPITQTLAKHYIKFFKGDPV